MPYSSRLGKLSLRWVSTAFLALVSVSCLAVQGQKGGLVPTPETSVQVKPLPRSDKGAPKRTRASDDDWMNDALHNRKLMAEVSQLIEKLRDGLQVPPARSQSRILPRLDDSTLFYLALPNYGDTVHQALRIFQDQLKVSPELRAFIEKHRLEKTEANFESGLQKFYEFSQFLGDEVVLTGKLKGKEPNGVLMAEIKKPGLREFLEKLNSEVITSAGDRLSILDPQQLSAARADEAHGPAVLVSQDLLVLGLGQAGLREFQAQIGQDSPRFTTSALGQRLALAYDQGTDVLMGIDLHRLIGLIPERTPQDREMLEKIGVLDVNYLMVSSASSAGRATNIGELTFNSPRHGVVSWIAPPAPMGGLDFISDTAGSAGDVILKSPAQIFDETRAILGEAAFRNLTQMEAQMGVNLKRDLLSKLTGEIAFETRSPAMPMASGAAAHNVTLQQPGPFAIILGISDSDGLKQTLDRLLTSTPFVAGTREEDGITVHTLTGPGSDHPTEINYFFLDGYLVIAYDRDMANSALRAHRGARSLAKSGKLDTPGGGQAPAASVMFYQDGGQMLPAIFAQLPAEVRDLLPKPETINAKPNVVSISADDRAFRGATNSNVQTEVSVGLVVAAVAIPNLLRSRSAAQEASAAANLRVLNTAQVTYATSYPKQGYAASLAALGPGPGDCNGGGSTSHACLVDASLGGAACTSGKWCEKSGYKFSLRATCPRGVCGDYVATATPADAGKSGKSFCSTTDGVIRSHSGPSLTVPLTMAECKTWRPLD
jgi:type IV pilus assembly protein PilA